MKHHSYVAQLLAVIRQYGLARFARVKHILFLAEHGKLSETMAKAVLLTTLKPLIEAQELCPNLLPRPPLQEELGTYDLEFGELIESPGVRVGLRLLDRPRHLLISGATGSGKSVLLRSIINALDALNRRLGRKLVILVLCLKGDFADVAERLGRDIWDHYSVHDGFKLGLQSPGGIVPPDPWINQVTKVVAGQCGLILSASCLSGMMRFGQHALNPQPTRPMAYPSIPLLYSMSRTLPLTAFASKPDYAKTLIQRLEELTSNSEGIFDTFSGFDVVEHLIKPRRCAVVDMTLMDVRVAALLTELLASQLLYPRLYARHMVDTTECVLVIDEADALCSREASAAYQEGYGALGDITKRGREAGLMCLLSVSFLNRCSPYITGNATCKPFFVPQNVESLQEAVRMLQLPWEGSRLLTSLKPGECVYVESQGPWSHPVLVRVDYVAPSRDPRPSHFDRHPFLPSKKIEDIPELKAAIEQLKAQHRNQSSRKSEGLPQDAHDLLHAACDHPWYPVARLWEKVGRKPSPEAQKKARIALHNKGMAEFDQIRVGKRNCLLVIPTREGFETLQLQPRSYHGRGGIAHNHVSHWLAMWGKGQGYKTEIEALVPGTNHAADCLWSKDGILHAFEMVATCESNILSHLDACFIQSTAVTTVTLVAFQKSVLDDLRKIVTQERPLAPYLDRIRFVSAEQVLKEVF